MVQSSEHQSVAGPNVVAAQNLSKMLLTMSSPMPMPAPGRRRRTNPPKQRIDLSANQGAS